ncbi:hypothetical protein AB0G74_12610 [Streptomyces sp. NPDC020875]|uniref:hypothetical protein n=1 Tax=Streptomyces sp. NPDC020875 TaxID=3154898 RepID=UPI0034003798
MIAVNLSRPRGFPPDPERCEVCRTLRTRMHDAAAAGLIDPFIKVRDLRSLHENTAHTDNCNPHQASARPDRELPPPSAAQERVILAQDRVADRYLMGASLTRLAREYCVSYGWLAEFFDGLGIARRAHADTKAIRAPRPGMPSPEYSGTCSGPDTTERERNMYKRKSSTVKAVRAEAVRAARGEPATPEENQEAAGRRALMRGASTGVRRQHAQDRVQMGPNGTGSPDQGED